MIWYRQRNHHDDAILDGISRARIQFKLTCLNDTGTQATGHRTHTHTLLDLLD